MKILVKKNLHYYIDKYPLSKKSIDNLAQRFFGNGV